jgi:hypothetical protein
VAYINFAHGDATPKWLLTIPAERMVISAAILLEVALDGAGAALSIGDADNPQRLLAITQCDPHTAGTYISHPTYSYPTSTSVFLYITPGSAVQGRGVIKINYSTI